MGIIEPILTIESTGRLGMVLRSDQLGPKPKEIKKITQLQYVILSSKNRFDRRAYYKKEKKEFQGMTWQEINTQIEKREPYINHEKVKSER